MAFISECQFEPEDRPCPRWGEEDNIEYGRNYIVNDGFSRFRNYYSGIHEVPIKHLEGYEFPRPVDVDVRGGTYLPGAKRFVDRNKTQELFPQLNPSRLENQGENCLSENTRQSIENMTTKLYRHSGYRIQFPGKSEVDQKTHLYNINRSQLQKHVNFEDSVAETKSSPICAQQPFDSRYNQTHLQHVSSTNSITQPSVNQDVNQNFLLSAIYNYKLPSALHMPDDHWQEDYLPLLKESVEDEPEVKNVQTFQRPKVHDKLGAFMDSVITEMNILQSDKSPKETVSVYTERESPDLCVGEWENSSVLYKLKLDDKTGTQRRYHSTIGEPIPDLRDNKKTPKRVNFCGYNSSVFR